MSNQNRNVTICDLKSTWRTELKDLGKQWFALPLRWNYQCKRGILNDTLMDVAQYVDFLALLRHQSLQTSQLIALINQSHAKAAKPIVLFNQQMVLRSPLMVIFDGQQSTLTTLKQLLPFCGYSTKLLLGFVNLNVDQQREWQQYISDELAKLTELDVTVHYLTLGFSAQEIKRFLIRERVNTVIIPLSYFADLKNSNIPMIIT